MFSVTQLEQQAHPPDITPSPETVAGYVVLLPDICFLAPRSARNILLASLSFAQSLELIHQHGVPFVPL
jgi:hypothetical protein